MSTIVMTGATSGLGAIAARIIAATPDTRVLVGTRGKKVDGVELAPLDLGGLASVREFARIVRERLGDTRIDALVLNAGIGSGGKQRRTEDGYETVFATNHLAHYLLLRLLTPQLSSTATVVVTTSDTHDPKLNKVAAPRHAYADLLAFPSDSGGPTALAGFRAYSSSKLCNLLTARGFARRSEAEGKHFSVVAYNPGLTPETQLNRDAGPTVQALTRTVVPLVRRFVHINSAEEAGRTLADLTLGGARPPQGRIYASLVRGKLTWPDPSQLAQSNDAMTSLWEQSAALVGLD